MFSIVQLPIPFKFQRWYRIGDRNPHLQGDLAEFGLEHGDGYVR